MNVKTAIRLAFDLLLLVAMVLLYNKRAFGIAYHEITGLALFALFTVHLLINRRWISAITARLAGGTVTARTAFSYAVSLGALIAFVLVGISGIAISRVVFDINSTWPVWKIMHKTGAAVALILIGIHVGLHHAFILGMLRQWFAVPENGPSILHVLGLARPLVAIPSRFRSALLKIFIVAVLAIGAAGFATTPFFKWLSLPFTPRRTVPHTPSGATPPSLAPPAATDMARTPPLSRTAAVAGNGFMQRTRARDGSGPKNSGRPRDVPGIATAAKTLCLYICMTLSIAIVTAFIDTLPGKAGRKKT
ncbi:DUF4405 domain-containing protein [Oxalobacter aliiformigenes]|uniref:DUF4405 domain-containing protein n=1 Tax=Oxalobacter aliiformigenes TaxID=2946593 RepID=UPI0022AEAE1E|nr:DUF4405 domain-containing protein [Oxalobacter aliiformigenes]MCZ4065805.1 DUF4405 domain-containing protein [Oxalobacter aliiformigenes]WAW00298.1 DUF4405 domain-containing protein [Oxalobacter aliiformigenes]